MSYNEELNPEHAVVDFYNNQVADDARSLDEATRNQVTTLTNKASAAIQESNAHHERGKFKEAHAALFVAANHIHAASRIAGASHQILLGNSPASAAQNIVSKYRLTYLGNGGSEKGLDMNPGESIGAIGNTQEAAEAQWKHARNTEH